MDSIDWHPRLGAILSITNLDQTVIKYISLQEIIGPDNRPSHALVSDILDRANFDVFRQNLEVRSLLVDPTIHALWCWQPYAQQWVVVEDARTFRAFIKQQVVTQNNQVAFDVSLRADKLAARIYGIKQRLTIDRASSR